MVRRSIRIAVLRAIPISLYWHAARIRGRLLETAARAPKEIREALARFYGETLSSSEVSAIASRSVGFQARLKPLKYILPRLCRPGTHGRWRVVGSESIDKALESGRGAILLTGHFGYSKLITPILRSMGYPATTVVAKSIASIEREERIDRWLSLGKLRKNLLQPLLVDSFERECIAAQLDVRPILHALSSNKLVLLAGDGLKAAEFAQLPFLGGTYPFAKGHMKIALMTGATVLPAFALEGDQDSWVVVRIGAPLALDPNESVEANLASFAKLLDEQVRSRPHLWYRWRKDSTLASFDGPPHDVSADRWNRGARRTIRAPRTRK